MKIRQPAVAGKFYPSSKKELNSQLDEIYHSEKKHINYSLANEKIIGGIIPHAGYMFSAYQALHFFEILKNSKQVFDTFFIINPNHTGYGPEIALEENEYWKTPYGNVEIDRVFHGFMHFSESAESHKYEHSGEVVLPLLQYSIDYPFKIVPITMFRQSPENAQKIANSIYEANKHLHKEICVIASSDFSHFVNPEEGKRLDELVIKEIKSFNAEGVFKEVHEKRISVCGFGPIMTLIEYSKLVSNNPRNIILKTGNSGEIMDSKEVVDYVSMLFYK